MSLLRINRTFATIPDGKSADYWRNVFRSVIDELEARETREDIAIEWDSLEFETERDSIDSSTLAETVTTVFMTARFSALAVPK